MNTISFEGFNAKYLTFLKEEESELKKGDFVGVSDNFTVTKFVSGGDIVGKCVDIRDDLVTVQVSGYMTAAIAPGQKLSYGYSKISLDSSGRATLSVTATRPILIVNIEGTKTVGFIL